MNALCVFHVLLMDSSFSTFVVHIHLLFAVHDRNIVETKVIAMEEGFLFDVFDLVCSTWWSSGKECVVMFVVFFLLTKQWNVLVTFWRRC